jgi:hypothetical protein
MTDIAPVSGVLGRVDHAVVGVDRQPRTEAKPPTRPSDRVEVSERARYLGKLASLPVRQDLIDQARREIAAGTYDSLERLEGALESLGEDLGLKG